MFQDAKKLETQWYDYILGRHRIFTIGSLPASRSICAKKCRYRRHFHCFLKNLSHDITTIFKAYWLAHYHGSGICVDGLPVVTEAVYDIYFSALGK